MKARSHGTLFGMRSLGIVADPKGGRPTVTAVLLDQPPDKTILVVTHFEITSAAEDLPAQLDTLYKAMRTQVSGLLPVDRAVVRRADKARVPSDTDGPRTRLLAEGVITAAVRSVVPHTLICTGLELGRWAGTDKDTVEKAGAALINAAGPWATMGLAKRLGVAAAAAMPALTRH